MKPPIPCVAILLLVSCAVAADAPVAPSAAPAPPDIKQKPWLHPFKPKREFYVSPAAGGNGTSANAPMNLAQAAANAEAGDLYWLLDGQYGGFGPAKNGAEGSPIVWRARPGQRATFPKVVIQGAHNWVWGLEVTNPSRGEPAGLGGSGSIIPGPYSHIINCVVHDVWGNGIGGWMTGPGHVYYGNIVYRAGFQEDPRRRGYPIYTQNRYTETGYKYIVQNMFLDVRPDVGGMAFDFHGYSEQGATSGFYIARNIMSNGHFVLGGGTEPAFHEYVLENYFYRMPMVRVGYGGGSCQAEFRDNYLARSFLDTSNFWGLPEGTQQPIRFQKPGPNVYTGNSILLPHDFTVVLATTAGHTKEVGLFPLDPADTFDNNTYTEPFKARLNARNKEQGGLDLAQWRAATAEAGKAFDANSNVVPPPTEPKIVLLVNDYDLTRAHLAIFNWGQATTVPVDLSALVPQGASFRIDAAKNPFGIPVVAGKYAGPAQVPMGAQTSGLKFPEEFAAFVVTFTPVGGM